LSFQVFRSVLSRTIFSAQHLLSISRWRPLKFMCPDIGIGWLCYCRTCCIVYCQPADVCVQTFGSIVLEWPRASWTQETLSIYRTHISVLLNKSQVIPFPSFLFSCYAIHCSSYHNRRLFTVATFMTVKELV